MIAARSACRTFVETVDSMGHALYYPLLCATCICYAKAFVESRDSGLGPLSGHWREFPDKRLQNAHNLMIKARHEIVAHNDMDVRKVSIVPPGTQLTRTIKPVGVGIQVNIYYFQLSVFRDFMDTCQFQIDRLSKAIDEEILVLYGLSQLPTDVFPLTFEDDTL